MIDYERGGEFAFDDVITTRLKNIFFRAQSIIPKI